jgi:hypothetical protein
MTISGPHWGETLARWTTLPLRHDVRSSLLEGHTMAGRAPRMKKVRVHAHVGVGGSSCGVAVEVDVLQPDWSAEPPNHRAATETPGHRAPAKTPGHRVPAETPGHRATAGGSSETRGRHPPPVLVDGGHRSTERRRLREEIEGEFMVVAVHGPGGRSWRDGVHVGWCGWGRWGSTTLDLGRG